MEKLLLIADDLTGALDTGIQFVEKGIKAEIIIRDPNENKIDFSSIKECQVLIVDTETRHMEAQEAYEIVLGALIKASTLGFTYFFKKTDSALRGNVSSELKALLDFSKTNVHFIPAYPKMNRVTKKGVHYVDGIKVSESIFGQDPFSSVESSYIPDIFSPDVNVSLKEDMSTNSKASIIVYDSISSDNISSILDNLTQQEQRFMAGCAGLAEIIPQYLDFELEKTKEPKICDSTITFSGSLNDITHRQLDYAEDFGIPHYVLSESQKNDPYFYKSDAGKKMLREIKEKLKVSKNIIISVGSGNNEAIIFPSRREKVGNMLGKFTRQLIKENADSNLFVIGGDTAVSLIYQLDMPNLIPVKQIREGVVLSQIEKADFKINLITKSGGFGDKNVIVETIQKLGNLK